MVDSINFETGNEGIQQFILEEYPNFPLKLSAQLINLCSTLGSYEEEGVKLRPNILFTNKIDSLIKSIKNSYKLKVFEEATESTFRTCMKSLITFSAHSWNIYVQLNNDGTYEYGLYRSFNSVREHSFNTNLFLSEDIKEKTDTIFAFLIQSISVTSIMFKSLKGKILDINFSLESKKSLDFKEEINEFVDASFSKLHTTNKKLNDIKTLYQNIFENVFKNIHGCICVVVDKDYVDNGFFADGIWLSKPIEFSKLFTQASSADETKLLAFSELFMDMLNYDGITIVDNKGRIRAYNVFVESDVNKDINILGGARKRAAFTVINSRVKKIVGVYFQSQEGEIFYNRNRNFKERIKKVSATAPKAVLVATSQQVKQVVNTDSPIPLIDMSNPKLFQKNEQTFLTYNSNK